MIGVAIETLNSLVCIRVNSRLICMGPTTATGGHATLSAKRQDWR